MITVMAVDDEPDALEHIVAFINKTPFLKLVFSGTSPLEALGYLSGNKTDLIFLDVQMPGLTGIEFIKAMPGNSKVILSTAYTEYAMDGFEHNIVDYLLKPVNYARFLRAVNKASELINAAPAHQNTSSRKNSFMFIKSEVKGKMVRIDYDEIDYIESLRNYAAFYKGTSKTIAALHLKDLETELPEGDFIRVHKSFIVPLKNIKLIEGNFIRLKNNAVTIPIGATYKESVLKQLGINS